MPDLDDRIAEQLVATVGRLRDLELKKAPSIAESVDWARTLVALEIRDLDEKAIADTLGVVLKHASDHERAVKELRLAMTEAAGLVDRHIAFLEALRGAGLSVSLAEDLDAVAALRRCSLGRPRRPCATAYAATLVKRQAQRPTFDALFDLYFPRLVGDGVARRADDDEADEPASATTPQALRGLPRRAAPRRSADGDQQALAAAGRRDGRPVRRDARPRARAVVVVGVHRPAAGLARPSWSTGSSQALLAEGRTEDEAQPRRRPPGRRLHPAWSRTTPAAGSRRRRGPTTSPTSRSARRIDQLDFTAARKADLEQMRREIYPLARRLATRLTQEHHARRRGPLDFRRTVRASISTGGVPLTTHHRPKRPHRTELVVLCDVSGSVANFAQFTLLLVFALRDQFQKVRAFTFIDHVHEVTHHFRPGADVVDVMADLAASTAHAALWGRTNYGRAFTKFVEQHADALGPKTSLLILGDARSNYSDLAARTLQGDRRRGPARLVAQPRAPPALGHRRLRRPALRRDRADGGVPQPHPARRVRARHPVTGGWSSPCIRVAGVRGSSLALLAPQPPDRAPSVEVRRPPGGLSLDPVRCAGRQREAVETRWTADRARAWVAR